jgi:hypothetical protein
MIKVERPVSRLEDSNLQPIAAAAVAIIPQEWQI